METENPAMDAENQKRKKKKEKAEVEAQEKAKATEPKRPANGKGSKKKKNRPDDRLDCELVVLCGMEEAMEFGEKVTRPRFAVVGKFKARDVEAAADHVEKWNFDHPGQTAYWRWARPETKVIMEDGTTIPSPDDDVQWYIEENLAKLREELKCLKSQLKDEHDHVVESMERRIEARERFFGKKWVRSVLRVWLTVWDFLSWNLWGRWDAMYEVWSLRLARIWNFVRTGHDLTESWALDSHLLSDLRYNLKVLLRDSHGIPTEYVAKAVAEEHRGKKGFDAMKWLSGHQASESAMRRAEELRMADYSHLVNLIETYLVYTNQATVDDHIEVQPLYLRGTYQLLDYMTMFRKSQEIWDEIWREVARHGQGFWD